MRAALALFALIAAACSGRQKTPADLCLEAARRGPPPATLSCEGDAEVRTALEPPSRLSRIPSPGTSREPAVAERRWCAGPDGAPSGPYVALDRSGQVVESGRYGDRGERDGIWIVWSRAAPRAVASYRRGESTGLDACDLTGLQN